MDEEREPIAYRMARPCHCVLRSVGQQQNHKQVRRPDGARLTGRGETEQDHEAEVEQGSSHERLD